MKNLRSASLVAAVFLAGCQSPIAGTWKLAPNQPETHVTVAEMTLANDGSFTANAKYGQKSEVMSGWYELKGGELKLTVDGKPPRVYGAKVKGDELTLTHEKSANGKKETESVKMMRLRRG